MDFTKIAPLFSFIDKIEPVSKMELYSEFYKASQLSAPTFSNLLFELQALGVLKKFEKQKFILDKENLSLLLKKYCYQTRNGFSKDEEERIKKAMPEWWEKWGKSLKELLK